MTDEVWLAAYGSSLCYDRFCHYLCGGRAEGSRHTHQGCRNQQEPGDERAAFLPYSIRFSKSTRRWRGAVAILDPKRQEDAQTLGRLYRIQTTQLRDILDDICGERMEKLPVDGKLPAGHHFLTIAQDWDGLPAYAITASPGTDAAPDHHYLRAMVAGLTETYRLGRQGLVRYLSAIPGLSGQMISKGALGRMWDDECKHCQDKN